MQKQNIKGGKQRRELLSEIRRRINKGESRQDILSDLSMKYYEEDWLALFISRVPSPDEIQEMKTKNSLLVALIFIWVGIYLLFNLSSIVSLISSNNRLIFILPFLVFWPVLFVWLGLKIKKYDGLFYRFTGLAGIIMILNNLRGTIDNPPANALSLIFLVFFMILLLSMTLIAFQIKKKYFPHIAYYGAKKDDGKYILGREESI
jgi:hypothetical protein